MSKRECLKKRSVILILSIILGAIVSNLYFITATAPQGTGCTVDYAIQNDWGSGATVTVTIKNNGLTALNGWTLAWTFAGDQIIANLWDGIVTQSGTSVTVKSVGYNGMIAANGGTASFGFNLRYSDVNAKPTGFTLNGTACQVQ